MDNEGYLLLIEDNIEVQNNNRKILERRGYPLKLAMTLAQAREIIAADPPRAIILDVILPDGSGLDFLTELRRTSHIPVLLLTALSTPADIIAGLNAGGDDYLPKPYNLAEFLARVNALLRRAEQVPEIIRKGMLTLHMASGQAFLAGVPMQLSQKEFQLLYILVQNEGLMVTSEYLYEKAWGMPMMGDTQSVKSAVSRLRKRLSGSGFSIMASRGKGYRFKSAI